MKSLEKNYKEEDLRKKRKSECISYTFPIYKISFNYDGGEGEDKMSTAKHTISIIERKRSYKEGGGKWCEIRGLIVSGTSLCLLRIFTFEGI